MGGAQKIHEIFDAVFLMFLMLFVYWHFNAELDKTSVSRALFAPCL